MISASPKAVLWLILSAFLHKAGLNCIVTRTKTLVCWFSIRLTGPAFQVWERKAGGFHLPQTTAQVLPNLWKVCFQGCLPGRGNVAAGMGEFMAGLVDSALLEGAR